MGTTSAPLAAAIPRPPAVGFVARRDEEGRDIVERLKGNLEPAQQRLVVLWGPGGVGKTTLAFVSNFIPLTNGIFLARP